MANKLVLLRHGESQWNLENRFTGWTDVSLTNKGQIEAQQAGALLKDNKFKLAQRCARFLLKKNRFLKPKSPIFGRSSRVFEGVKKMKNMPFNIFI